jgi:hypothetical protein
MTTIMICGNEHGLHWVYDSRLPCKAFKFDDTPPGSYWAISGAFAGKPLEAIFLQELDKELPSYVDPDWIGVLNAFRVEIGSKEVPQLSLNYPEFISPHADNMRLLAIDYLNDLALPDFNSDKLRATAAMSQNLNMQQIDTAISYAQAIKKDSESQGIDPIKQIDNIFAGLSQIEKDELLTNIELLRVDDKAFRAKLRQDLDDLDSTFKELHNG